jgi:pheromone shutdown protein TraB
MDAFLVRLCVDEQARSQPLPLLRSGEQLCEELAYAVSLRAAQTVRETAGVEALRGSPTAGSPPADTSLQVAARRYWRSCGILNRQRLLLRLLRLLLRGGVPPTEFLEPFRAVSADALERKHAHRPGHGRGARCPADSPAHRRPLSATIVDRALPWMIPVIFVGLLPLGIVRLGVQTTLSTVGLWMLANGVLGLAAATAIRAHPWTLLAAATLGPISALHPLFGTGFVLAWAEYRSRRPRWADLSTLAEDLRRPRGWLENRALRVMTAFLAGAVANTMSNLAGAYLVARAALS